MAVSDSKLSKSPFGKGHAPHQIKGQIKLPKVADQYARPPQVAKKDLYLEEEDLDQALKLPEQIRIKLYNHPSAGRDSQSRFKK